MADYPIPTVALDDRLGWLGTSGSGKTYNAGGGVERLLQSGARVVIVDPLGVWWGLRLLADGKTSSPYKVAIFGGPNGDLPLNEHVGALIGETAATMAESCIVDLGEFTSKTADRRFMAAFLETLYRKAGGEPFHLVVDEADLFAPQKPGKGDEVLLGHMENIVRRGRVKGFIPWLISQRPAVLNKNVLSQVDGLIAFMLTASHDRNALDAWIEGQADPGQGKQIKDSLPTLPVGTGVVWLPRRQILETVGFPAKLTFDSSRTPKRGERRERRDLKPLDLGALEQKLATVAEEAKANDPKLLRAEVGDLKRRLAAAEKGGAVEVYQRENERLLGTIETLKADVQRRAFIANQLEMRVSAARKALEPAADTEIPAPCGGAPAPDPRREPSRRPEPSTPPRVARHAPGFRGGEASSPDGGGASLTGPQAHLLGGLAWWTAMGHSEPTRTQLAAKIGWKPGGSNIRGRLSELSTAGLIEYPNQGRVRLTASGASAAPAPDMNSTLLDSIRQELTGPQRLLFEVLLERVETMERKELAEAVGWEPGGSNIRGRLSEMSSLELIEYPSRGEVRLQDWVTG
ncbi:MAG: hypothetical protein QOH47_2364 [Sphingomonadales bacterium]|jgi:hypothetical protein|nr:hypothetical protein [Sphingomonadales bacterium]